MFETEAVTLDGAGGPEVLGLAPLQLEVPTAAEVRVAVEACGLNRADCLQRRGFYPAPPGVPANVPGLEFAGRVDEVGPDVTDVSVGDRVMGIVGGGAMARHLVTRAQELMPIPDGMSFEDAAAIPEVFVTAYDAAVVQGGLDKGQTLLVHAVGSGVGTAALQLACAWQARCIGTARSEDKLARAKALGLDHGVLVVDKLFSDQVKELAPEGVNVVLDTVGGAYLAQNIKVVAIRGKIVVIGLLGGNKAEISLGALLAKRASLIGSVLRSRSALEKGALTARFVAEVLPHFKSGALKPVVDDVMPMKDIAAAHARMDANETFGKIVMRW